MAECHTIGTDVIVRGTFTNASGVLTTPTTYTVDYRDPGGIITTIAQGSIDVISTGVLDAAVPTDEAGVWRYQWNVVVGGDDQVLEGVFCVKPSGVDSGVGS